MLRLGNFEKKLTSLFSASLIGESIQFAIGLALARIYSPEDFGFFVLSLTVCELLNSVSSLKLDLGILKYPDRSKEFTKAAILTSVVISTFLLFITSVLLIVFQKYNFIVIVFYGYALALVFNFYRFQELFHIQNDNYKSVIKGKVILKPSIPIFQILLSFFNGIGLSAGRIIAYVIGIKILWSSELKILTISNFTAKRIIYLIKTNRDMVRYSTYSSILRIGQQNLNKILLPIFFTKSFLGLYGWAINYAQAPLSLVAMSIRDVLFSQLSRKLNIQIFIKSLLYQIFVGLIFYGILFYYGKEIFSFAFGETWELAGEIAEILAPYLLLVFLTSPNTCIFYVIKKESYLFYFDAINTGVTFLIFIVVSIIYDSPMITISYISQVGAVIYTILLVWMIFLVMKYGKNQ